MSDELIKKTKKEILTFLFVFSFLFISTNVVAQKITYNPYVDYDNSDEISVATITSIITDDDFTMVTFQYATTLFEPWIMINSKTFIEHNLSKSKVKILEWGMINNEDEDLFVPLYLNEQYSIKRRTAYDFYMIFPEIPDAATLLNVVVPAQHLYGEKDGFYWEGIHINDKTTEDMSRYGRDYSQKTEFTPISSGSGFAINSDGYIATCYHVIEDSEIIRVRGINGNFEKYYTAKVVSVDEKNDLAILKVDGVSLLNIPYVLNTSLSDVGEDVFVLGYPQTQYLGEELKLTTGVISSRSGFRGDITTYQISAQVLPGNSGGPLFDNEGKIIGVVNAKFIEPNVSYAVKLSYLDTLIEKSKVELLQPTSNTIVEKTLSEKVKAIRNYIYIIEVQ